MRVKILWYTAHMHYTEGPNASWPIHLVFLRPISFHHVPYISFLFITCFGFPNDLRIRIIQLIFWNVSSNQVMPLYLHINKNIDDLNLQEKTQLFAPKTQVIRTQKCTVLNYRAVFVDFHYMISPQNTRHKYLCKTREIVYLYLFGMCNIVESVYYL